MTAQNTLIILTQQVIHTSQKIAQIMSNFTEKLLMSSGESLPVLVNIGKRPMSNDDDKEAQPYKKAKTDAFESTPSESVPSFDDLLFWNEPLHDSCSLRASSCQKWDAFVEPTRWNPDHVENELGPDEAAFLADVGFGLEAVSPTPSEQFASVLKDSPEGDIYITNGVSIGDRKDSASMESWKTIDDAQKKQPGFSNFNIVQSERNPTISLVPANQEDSVASPFSGSDTVEPKRSQVTAHSTREVNLKTIDDDLKKQLGLPHFDTVKPKSNPTSSPVTAHSAQEVNLKTIDDGLEKQLGLPNFDIVESKSSPSSSQVTIRTLQSCFSPSKEDRIYVSKDAITNDDILCGRELAGSNHPGNVAYLRMVADNKALHRSFGSQHGEKTKIRNMIVQELVDRGGRFVRIMNDDGNHHLLTIKEAQAKMSQSLREGNNKKKRKT